MEADVTISRLFRLAALSGLLSAVVLLVNAARRTGVIPNSALAHGIAPLAEIFGLLALTGLFLQPKVRASRLGFIGYVINFLGLAGVLGAEFLINLIFPAVGTAETKVLLHGTTGVVLVAGLLLYLVGSVTFGVALWFTSEMPRIAIAAYGVGSVVVGLRQLEPEAALITGLLVSAVGIIWLSLSLARQWSPSTANRSQPEQHMLASS